MENSTKVYFEGQLRILCSMGDIYQWTYLGGITSFNTVFTNYLGIL